jgi:ADP-ribosylglycohydrolase
MTEFWMKLPFLLNSELAQLEEEGCDVSSFKARVAACNEQTAVKDMLSLYDELSVLKPGPEFPFEEPSDLEGIKKASPKQPSFHAAKRSDEEMKDHFLGAWLGRCAGCTLGKPVEGMTHDQVEIYLKAAGAYPLADYVPMIHPYPENAPLLPCSADTTKGNISYMSRDDDTDYTLIGLSVMEHYGPKFTSADVAETWLNLLPYQMVFTAERIAYRNLVNEMPIPESAVYQNPFREWIGAQIRSDGFAYAAAGMPETAAEFAFRDASMTHVKNGIYGEMFFAAVEAAAFATKDIHELIQIGLAQVPEKSRFTKMVNQVLEWSSKNPDWQTTWNMITREFGKYFWVHTLNNAAIVLTSLLYGEGDLGKTIGIAVMCGWDTDCTGATAGSIIGAMHGAKALPGKWVDPFQDTMHSAIMGFDGAKISDLALRSWKTYTTVKQYKEG